jgi:hypothetical protein
MKSQARNSELRWPEFAGSPPRQSKQVKAAICPVVFEEGDRCFAVAIDQRWLCGSDGEMTFFNTMAAASRFLHLVKVPVHGLIFGAPQAVALRERQALQCFRLSAQGLASCSQCQVGQQSHAREAREFARMDDRW